MRAGLLCFESAVPRRLLIEWRIKFIEFVKRAPENGTIKLQCKVLLFPGSLPAVTHALRESAM